MKRILAVMLLAGAACATEPRLKPGDVAPPFKVMATTGREVALADYRGKQTVVLAFFVKAGTPG